VPDPSLALQAWNRVAFLSKPEALAKDARFREHFSARFPLFDAYFKQIIIVDTFRGEEFMNLESRFRGAFIGLAIGDAVGTTLEFCDPGTFQPIDDMIGGGPFRLPVGAWTDDTSMALCLAESLITQKGFDPLHQLETYCRWWRTGHLSSTGTCFDIGLTTRSALRRFEQSNQPYCGDTDPWSSGNGSIMRLAPVPMFFSNRPEEAIRYSADSSRTTHGSEECVDACRYFGGLIVGAIHGRTKEELLDYRFSPMGDEWKSSPLSSRIGEIASGSFKRKEPPEIEGSGYVVKSLEAALWAFHRTSNFREGLLLAVNLGNDADTTGAVYGQIAGAFYGVDGIPPEWREKLARKEEMEGLIDGLWGSKRT
jgi:ADP-ribosyl-[dinitrogen reductase] hydrolase